MLKNLFNGNGHVYHVQYSSFLSHLANNQINEVILAGYQDKGFCIVGRIKNDDADIFCMLVSQKQEIRFIKCPDNAHSFLYKMGINEFKIDASQWDMDNAFNPHQVSYESRQRKKEREAAL